MAHPGSHVLCGFMQALVASRNSKRAMPPGTVLWALERELWLMYEVRVMSHASWKHGQCLRICMMLW